MGPHPSKDRAGLAWADMSWREVERAAEEGFLAVLPLGSTEQHGPMIPVGCDVFLAATFALEGARLAREKYGLGALVLPPLPYGYAPHHTDFPGTVSLGLELYVRLINTVVRNVVNAGFKRIVLVSGHGGNIMPARMALKELGNELYRENVRDVKLYMADDKNCFVRNRERYDQLKQGQFNFHADAVETSYYKFLRPDLVKEEGMVEPEVKVTGMPMHEGWRTKEITDSGASGDPTLAREDYGRMTYEQVPEDLAAFLKKVAED